jgi:hypothetical protein
MEEVVTQAFFMEFMGAPDTVQLDANTAIWRMALTPIPTELLVDMFFAAVQQVDHVPKPHDVLRAYRDYLAAQPARTFQQEEQERMAALPMPAEDGPGRRVWLAFGRRGSAVVCNCEPVNGLSKPAMLTECGLNWVCRDGECDFMWSASMTETAPLPSQAGPLAEAVKAPQARIERGNFSKGLQMFADDAGVDLTRCTPQQFVDFRLFAQWFRENYPTTKINNALLKSEYATFEQARQMGWRPLIYPSIIF